MASIWDQVNKIIDDLHVIKKEFESELPKYAEQDLVYAHKSIIAAYYAQYTPNTYRRNPNGQNLMSSLISKRVRSGSAKITVGSYGLGTHGRAGRPDINEDNVFDLMWNRGIRGLPYRGVNPLPYDVDWMGNHFNRGDHWINPKWSGTGGPWKNIYRARFFGVEEGTPDQVMSRYVDKWGEIDGETHADKIADKLRSKL